MSLGYVSLSPMPEAITFQHYEVLVREDGAPWELGRGAMGVTYKALDTNLRVPVALKVIHPRQLDSELVAQRFVREARAAARLRHPHIAAVYHLGQEGENWFYAMEFVSGDTAEGLVKREGPLPEGTVVTLAIQAARALNAAAALGLVHRDIKPSNLMLSREGDEWQLKLIDFGLARTFAGGDSDEDLAAVTHSGFVGTPYYASPEQLEQKELDIRSDIYSLGVTMWFLLTGKVPFTGSVVSVLSQHLHKAPPFEQLDGCTSPALRSLIERMLAKDPAARPQSALDLRRELETCPCAPPTAAVTNTPAIAPPAATPPPPVSAEAAETLLGSEAPVVEPTSISGGSQFEGADTVAEFGFGQLCRTHDRNTGEPFAMLRLGPLRGLEDSAVATLRETIDRARTIQHPQVWRVHTLEVDAAASRIVMDWSDGYSWRDLLRRHRELEPAEAFRLLNFAAGGIDAILAAGIDQPDVSLAGLWCEAPAPDALPIGVKVSPLGILRTFSLDATWIGEGTMAGPGATGPESGAKGAIRGLAQVAYETLGGAVTAPGFPPLPALSEGANKVLRTALRDPGQFASASALVEQLTRAHAEPEPIASYRAPVPLTPPADTSVPAPPENKIAAVPATGATAAPIWNETPGLVPPPELPLELEDSGSISEAAPAPPPAPAFAGSQGGQHEPARPPRGRGLALAAGLAVIAGSLLLVFHRADESAGDRIAGTPANPPSPSVEKSSIAPQPLSPPPTTPAPVVVIKPPPATPPPIPPPPPAPTREEIVKQMQARAGEFRKDGKWKESTQALLQMRESFPEYWSAADVDLELLFRDIRWRYTRYREQPPDLKAADVEALRPELERADRAGIIGARMLLGEHLSTRKDWPKAIEHYERARDRAPKATTRIGLLYARFSNDPVELAKAWQYLQAAHEAGDLDGKIAVAECLIHGSFGGAGGDKLVPGLQPNPESGVRLLREIIAAAPSRREPAELANAQIAETYVSEPNRSKLVLANYYFNQEQPKATPPSWYRSEKARADDPIDHAKEMRRLFDEAKDDWNDAYGFLGMACAMGIGEKPDRAAAKAYFEQGVTRQNVLSMFNYAVFISQSAPPGKIPTEARKLFVQAAEKGHEGAIKLCDEQKIPFKRPGPL